MRKIALSIIAASFLIGCSTNKNSFKNRNYHKMTAWFNGIFNAEEEFEKANATKIENFREDYSEILPLGTNYFANTEEISSQEGFLGFNNNNNSVKPSGYSAVEQKALSVIEKHSMLINGKEYNTLIARAYLLIGKSKFYSLNYFESLDAFNYVLQNFKDTKYYQEAAFYSALANIKGGNYFDGQEKLLNLYDNNDLPKDLQFLVASNYATFLIENEKYNDAIEPLKKADYFSKNGQDRYRNLYALGQVYSKLGMQNEAGEIFSRLYKMKPGFDMEVKSLLAIANNFDPKVNNYNNYKTHLLNESKKGIYTSKLNEFYYGISELAFKNGNVDEALEYSKLSLKEPLSDEYIRGKAYENIGNIYMSKNDYIIASTYYDSAVTFYKKESIKDQLQNKNVALKNLMEKHYLVEKNDSILKLTALSKEDQISFFTKHIEKIKVAEEKIETQEKKQMTDFQLENKVESFSSSFADKNNTKFYFYNSSLKSDGKVEFQRIWNNINLRDNWRNSSNSEKNLIEDKENELKGNIDSNNPRRFEVEFYTEKIPTSPKIIHDLKIEKDTTQLALGIAYYEEFNDILKADETLNKLISSNPKQEETKLKAIYQLYRIHKDRDKSLENKYKELILNQYPNTIYAGYILNPNVDYVSPETKEALDEYKLTYELFRDEKYDAVKSNVAVALKKFPTEIILAKFALLNAFAISKTENKENFIHALEILIAAYDKTDEAKYAKNLLSKLKNTETDHKLQVDKIEKIEEEKDEVNVNETEPEILNPFGNIESKLRIKPKKQNNN